MNATELFRAGKLTEAIQALAAELRDHPTDAKLRTFYFELLCFAGDYDRAEKHLHILSQAGPNSELGALLYRGVLAAERARQEMFEKGEHSTMVSAGAEPVAGTLNGQPVEALADADKRIGPRLETFAAGTYLWIPFAHIQSIEIAPPKKLRDLLWVTAQVRTGPAFKGTELGECLIPVLSPLSWQHEEDEVKLGRSTVWEQYDDGSELPFGQKMLLVDGEEIPLLDVRSLRIQAPESATAAEAQ